MRHQYRAGLYSPSLQMCSAKSDPRHSFSSVRGSPGSADKIRSGTREITPTKTLTMNLNAPAFSQFIHDGLKLAFVDEGNPEGAPVLLIHGFASTAIANWVNPGWLKTLGEAGYRVIAIDNRGHGASDKSYDAEAYRPWVMAEDAVALLDHLGIPE